MKNHKPKIGITIGDLNGIGIEVILKTFSDSRMLERCTPIVYGSSKAISYHRKVLGMEHFKYNIISGPEKTRHDAFNVLNCWDNEISFSIGKPDKSSGLFSLKSLEAASYDISENKIDAIVTAPVNKFHLSTEQNNFVGQTEFFAKKFDVQDSLMFLVSDNLKVGLVTNHVPLRDVVDHITPEKILTKIKIMEESLSVDFQIDRPKIAVLALNPHAGDEGVIGTEDDELIKPIVKKAREQNLLAFGPYAADGFFGSGTYREFDGILAMYHDQGLIPFKALSFGHGVNMTAGLPIVRTSPDHGTAYDIAGKNIASPDSFRKSIFLALDIIENRKHHSSLHANPIQKNLIEADKEEKAEA